MANTNTNVFGLKKKGKYKYIKVYEKGQIQIRIFWLVFANTSICHTLVEPDLSQIVKGFNFTLPKNTFFVINCLIIVKILIFHLKKKVIWCMENITKLTKDYSFVPKQNQIVTITKKLDFCQKYWCAPNGFQTFSEKIPKCLFVAKCT